MDVLVYGCGHFEEKYKLLIQEKYNIVGYVDKMKGSCYNGIFRNIEECDSEFDCVLVMIENIIMLFDAIKTIVMEGVSFKHIVLGISHYGKYSKNMNYSVSFDNGIQIETRNNNVIAYNPRQFYEYVKTLLIPSLEEEGNRLRDKAKALYERIFNLYWAEEPYSYNLECEMHYRFYEYGSFGFGTIAVFNMRAIYEFENPYVLDLGCADGFYYKYFYSKIPHMHYVGCDLDEYSIQKAQNFKDKQSEFIVADFLKDMPKADKNKCFTNILWNESFQMFNTQSQRIILSEIKKRLDNSGVLSGTAYVKNGKEKDWKYCINAIDNTSELRELLESYFENVFVYNDLGMNRMVVFIASDAKIPFSNYKL